MDCQTIQDQLSALQDGALDRQKALLVEAHLADCELCREQKHALSTLDASLSRAFASERRAADRVAAGVLGHLAAAAVSESRPHSAPPWRRALGYLIAMAAGFLLAGVWFRPWQQSAGVDGPTVTDRAVRMDGLAGLPGGDHEQVRDAEPVAHLVHTIGPIAYRPPSGSDWQQVDSTQLQVFSCPSDSSVRTAPGALAELETLGGSRIRLNESSEVAFVSDQELELKQGQIWCRAAGADTLRVTTGDSQAAPSRPAHLKALVCGTSGEFVAACSPAQSVEVVSAAGNVEVSAGGQAQVLTAGRSCTISSGEFEIRDSEEDLVHAQRWMQPLLTLDGHGNPELVQRVDDLLARIGRTKLAWLYEQDLRNLGEYAVLPLMRFVQSQTSRDEPLRRRTAMAILADTAPIWMVPDLIEMLEDDDPDIRVDAARGLTRLTGTNHGLEPETWGTETAHLTGITEQWRQWWQRHRFACPTAPPNLAPRSERTE